MFGMELMMTMIFLYYIFSIIPPAVAVYILIKWRAYRDGAVNDPLLGAKTLFYFFRTIAYQILLLGTALIFYAVLNAEFDNEAKIGLGLFTGGGLIFLLFHFLRHRLLNAELVKRVFNGFNLIVAGIIAMISMIAFFIFLFYGRMESIKLPLAGFLTYGLAALFQFSFFFGFPALRKR